MSDSVMTVLDRQGRPITARRIIGGARAAGLRLERGGFLTREIGCCCAGGGLALSIDPDIEDSDDADDILDRNLDYARKWGLSDGFEGEHKHHKAWGDSESYLACYAIGREVYARRHEADPEGTAGQEKE